MAPEQPTTIDLILVEQILSNLQSFTKVPKTGTLSQYRIIPSSSLFKFKTKKFAVFIYKNLNWKSRIYTLSIY